MAAKQQFQYLFRYIIVGDTAVGKSCLLLRFTDNRFRADHDLTIGVEFGAKIIDIVPEGEKPVPVKIQIWDTAGQESFRSITRSYYRGSAGALLVFDISRRATFDHLHRWLEEVKSHAQPHMALIVVGNKCDLDEKREVTYDEGLRFAKQHGLTYIETSAASSENVEKAFTDAGKLILNNIRNNVYDSTNEVCGVKRHVQSERSTTLQDRGSSGGCC